MFKSCSRKLVKTAYLMSERCCPSKKNLKKRNRFSGENVLKKFQQKLQQTLAKKLMLHTTTSFAVQLSF